jgi:hypothetical protein
VPISQKYGGISGFRVPEIAKGGRTTEIMTGSAGSRSCGRPKSAKTPGGIIRDLITMWLEELGNFLDQACAVLVCLNRDALRSPWVHYEVGAIANAANALEERQASANEGVHLARAFTPLLGVKPGEIEGPLAAFQSTVADDAKDMRRLIDTFTLELPADQQTTVWRKELDQTGLRRGQGSTSDSERSRYPSWARPFQLSIGYSGVRHSRSRRPSA